MSAVPSQKEWETYRGAELGRVHPILVQHGFTLDAAQPHITGERYLMQAVTTASGRKLILVGTRTRDGLRVIIKATSDAAGIRELEHEAQCRSLLAKLPFAYEAFPVPEHIATFREHGMYVAIHAYIEKERPFIELPIAEQFAYALSSFKAQEHAHASAYAHLRAIGRVFERYDATTYPKLFAEFANNIRMHGEQSERVGSLLERAYGALLEHATTLERYGDFLTHTDFVPHNFRIKDGTLYLLDLSSIRFGNKYEGWARFANFMALYEPALLEGITAYLRANRTPEEYLSFRLMRMFRLGEILWYYTQAVENSTGDLQKLNRARIELWTAVLGSVLDDVPLNEDVRKRYIATRETLRSPEEKQRQVGLH